ncbi:glycoside hydrolase family 20 protein [Parabacteroides sp. AGMB00274]|uniref:beta-N-acetylhexosaminidase n=1 Tax=Parabacteroides faecalis TaxID=2924040 RepID=A0ABT0C5N7_9BACT|nr:family 20 glycosylhydrolase [Parabacteroides faecalis]MCI7287554.1 glycoside hydrolase family 20 protein [Parabacteroides sp.]MCJ2382312.1 glycoside hydrolase family 20 protein [Parabacteroides faecalis]MDD6949902.1 family 20 glycosylhydrolase [Parabacteroides sp.]MDY6254622.1 family 20 glycosylhydrolase [Bacteroidales bacterium]
MQILSKLNLLGWSLAGLLMTACSNQPTTVANYEVVPMPLEINTTQQASFLLKSGMTVYYPAGNEKMQRNAEFLASYVKAQTGIELQVQAGEGGKGGIVLQLGLANDNPEAYQLKVDANQVVISSPSEAGVFYGIQTLRKAVDVAEGSNVELPAVEIKDQPRFGYRGMMLDVGRHFFSMDEIKTYIDMMALHNINRFHWHLSEDQGWRIEIKKYPKLTEIGSMRKETVIGHNSGKYDGKPYGGFYTQEQAKEIVAYAAERYITVIPEIDLPGHMQAALAAYPELGCTGGPYEVWTQWGVSDNVLCAGNDQTIQFIKDVLAEIVEIFPSEYIHVGGDECPKVKWSTCPKCQARIKALGLKSDNKHTKEERLQSYVIHEAEEFLNSKGRKMIGWDETLEGGLAPNATVMSWRGEAGGIEAAKQHHDVVMTPNTYLYFDYYQSKDTETEPMAIGGYLPIERVYSYEPMPKSLSPEEQKYIVGVQANLWTEYIPDFKQVQYMVLPRMAALCESQWCAPEKKNYEAFLQRVSRLVNIYAKNGWNYATHIFDVMLDLKPNTETGTLDAVARTIDNAPIYYTLDGSEPTTASEKYTDVIKIDKPCTLRTVAIRPSGSSKITKDEISFSKSSMKPITMLQPINKQYEFSGATVLVDGMTGNMNYKTGRWIAFYTNDLEAVIDLKEATEISSMTLHTCVEKGDWIFDTRGITVSVSDDNQTFKEVASEAYPAMKESDPNQIYTHELKFDPVKTRYVKVKALSEQKIPSWHGGKGNPGFLFVDEIILN